MDIRTVSANLLIASVLAALRAAGVKDEAFQALAHLYLGGLITAYGITRRPFYLWLTVALSVVEVVCFLAFRTVGSP